MKQEGNVSRSLAWRVLSVLVAILLTVSGVSSATASGKIAPDLQDGNPPRTESTTFEISGNIDNTDNLIYPSDATIGVALYDQLDNLAYTAAISQDYGDTTNNWDTEVADDFVVPGTDGIWDLRSIELYGACDTGYCSAFTVNVNIYTGSGILPDQLVYSAREQVVQLGYIIFGTTIRQYIIDLSTPAYLAPGTYWISVQANMGAASGNWGWLERSVQTGNWHTFRNPGGGWHEGCLTWCTGHPKYPDLMFRLHGNAGGLSKLEVDAGIIAYDRINSVVEHGTQPLIYASVSSSVPEENSVLVINTDTGDILATISVGFRPNGLAISPDNSRVYVVHGGDISGINVIDTTTNTVVNSFPITDQPYAYPTDLVYGGLGRLYVLVPGGVIKSFDPSNGALISELPASTGTILAVSPDGKTLCGSMTSSPSSISCYDISTDNPPPARTNSNVCNNVKTLDISSDGTMVYATCEGNIRIFDINTLAQTGRFDDGISFESAYSTPDGQVMLGADNTNSWLVDARTYLPIRILDNTALKLLKAGRDSRTVYATTYDPWSYYQYLYIYHFTYFQDVYWKHWARTWIERLYNAHITGGCGSSPLIYCPESSVTRAQMAVFLERGMNGSSFAPPAATGTTFGDVPNDHWASAWIEQLAADGITGGCSGGNYCPETDVTRAQMAVFLLRAIHGAGYVPPEPTGVFTDVPTNYWAAAWIEQLAAEGITSGCGGGNYCPDTPVTRAQMAVFLVKTFNLP